MTTATVESRMKIEDRIQENGFAIVSGESAYSKMKFSYTVGLADKQTSDLLMIGFEHDEMNSVLTKVAAHLGSGDILQGYEPRRVAGIIESGDVALMSVPENTASQFAHALVERAQGGPLNLVQVFLPDEKGLFPFEEGCDSRMAFKQRWFRVMKPAQPA